MVPKDNDKIKGQPSVVDTIPLTTYVNIFNKNLYHFHSC